MKIKIGSSTHIGCREILNIILVAAALMSAGLCVTAGLTNGIWLIPFVFCFEYSEFVMSKKMKMTPAKYIMVGISFVRYVALPFMYNYMNDDSRYYIDKGKYIGSYIQSELFNNMSVVLIMVVEMTTIFIVLSRVREKTEYKNIKLEYQTHSMGTIFFFIMCVGIALLLIMPTASGVYCKLHGITYLPSSFVSVLARTAITFIVIFGLKLIKNTSFHKMTKCILSMGLWILFTLECGLSPSGTLSRWGMMIPLIVGMIIIQRLYPKQGSMVITITGLTAVVAVLILTVERYDYLQDIGGSISFKRIFSYKMLNSYFDGPTNIAYSVDMVHSGKYPITIITFMDDFFRNMPILNHLLPENDSTVYYFNRVIHGSIPSMDQIVPLSGQGYAYLLMIGVVIMNAVMCCVALRSEQEALRTDSMLKSYIYLYLMTVCSISTMLNMTVVMQFVWIRILPIAVIALIDRSKIKIIKIRSSAVGYNRHAVVANELKYEKG